MAYSTDKYTISSGDRNGFYCLYNLVWDFGINGKYEYFQYIKNLSTNREKAVKKAQSYIGILDYDFNVNWDLDKWGTNEKKEIFKGYRLDDNAHVVSYYEDNEFINSINFPFNNDKQTFTGKILTTYIKRSDDFYGNSHKMYFLDDRGFVLNLTVPKKLDDNLYGKLDDYKGFRFSFNAILNEDTYTQDFKLEHKNCSQNLDCAFVKRPTQITMGDNNV